MRIASLLPSATEIVAALGLGQDLVAVSHECDHPPAVRGLPVVTRSAVDSSIPSGAIDAQVREHLASHTALYALDTDLLEQLRPDLIVNGNAYFSRPGPRLVESLEMLAHTLWPGTFDLPEDLQKDLWCTDVRNRAVVQP